MRHYFGVLLATLFLIIPWFAVTYPEDVQNIIFSIQNVGDQVASIFFAHNPKTIEQIKSRYDSATSGTYITGKKVKIILVPGHEPDFGGAEYGDLKERELSVDLAQELQQFLAGNPRFEVTVTRGKTSWNPIFENYFKAEWDNIQVWLQAHKEKVTNMSRLGLYKPIVAPVFHNAAPNDVAFRLYGISKWANENDVDIVIHIHFNDYPGHPNGPGKYSGFTIYVPQQEYLNSTTTQVLADSIFKRLEKYNPVSDFSGESAGVVQDPDLIAVGAFNSLDAASMLIEYGYIYEPQFTDDNLRAGAIKDLAFQTYLGLHDFFDSKNATGFGDNVDTLILPSKWSNQITEKTVSKDIFALQTALLIDGVYPAGGRSFNDCPRSGSLGPCTKAALDSFQKKYGISGEKGRAGKKTIEILNEKYTRGI